MLMERLQRNMCHQAHQLGKQPYEQRRLRASLFLCVFGAQQQMWLLLDDEAQRSNTIDTLLPLLILRERVIFEKTFQSSLSNNANEGNELWIGLVSARMLQKLFDKLAE